MESELGAGVIPMFRKFDLPNSVNYIRVHCAMILTVYDGKIIASLAPSTGDKIAVPHKMCGEDAAPDLPGFAVPG